MQTRSGSRFEAALAWYFVAAWGSGFIAARWMGEKLTPRQWLGIAVGLLGVALVAWRRRA